jgi:4a-hydroxytetrahydrobiopterin dehydratase
MSPQPLSKDEIAAALDDLPDWRARLGALHTAYRAPSADVAVELMHQLGQLANELDHHPDLDWRYDYVFLKVSTHSAGRKVTPTDLEFARRASELASRAGAQAHPEVARELEIAVDSENVDAVRATWAAALGYKEHGDDDLYDPWGRGPGVWFQRTDTPNPNRIHLDVWVEDADADAELAKAEAAGAERLDDHYRPSFTVIGDRQQNRFCVCTGLEP